MRKAFPHVSTLILVIFFFHHTWIAGKPIREENKKLRAEEEQAKERGEEIRSDDNANDFPVLDLFGIFVLPVLIAFFFNSSIIICGARAIFWLIDFVRLIIWLIAYAKHRNQTK